EVDHVIPIDLLVDRVDELNYADQETERVERGENLSPIPGPQSPLDHVIEDYRSRILPVSQGTQTTYRDRNPNLDQQVIIKNPLESFRSLHGGPHLGQQVTDVEEEEDDSIILGNLCQISCGYVISSSLYVVIVVIILHLRPIHI